jgi:hypothetical protein
MTDIERALARIFAAAGINPGAASDALDLGYKLHSFFEGAAAA